MVAPKDNTGTEHWGSKIPQGENFHSVHLNFFFFLIFNKSPDSPVKITQQENPADFAIPAAPFRCFFFFNTQVWLYFNSSMRSMIHSGMGWAGIPHSWRDLNPMEVTPGDMGQGWCS